MIRFHQIDINMLWIGDELSDLELLSIKSHQKVGHNVTLWSYNPLKNIPEGVDLKDANQILEKKYIFQYKVGEGKGSFSACSNLFRYKFLLEHGGWWSDTDVVVLKPFLFKHEYVFASERNRNFLSLPTSCVIKTPVNSDVMRYCWEQSHQIDVDTVEWGTIGPKLLAKSIFLFDLINFVLPTNIFCPVDWFLSEQDPVVSFEVDISSSYAVHFWHEMWRRKNINKNARFNPNCLYERVKNDILHVESKN